MLLRWFVNLYDLEIVEEDAFLKWKEDITDAYPGKGKALFQVSYCEYDCYLKLGVLRVVLETKCVIAAYFQTVIVFFFFCFVLVLVFNKHILQMP